MESGGAVEGGVSPLVAPRPGTPVPWLSLQFPAEFQRPSTVEFQVPMTGGGTTVSVAAVVVAGVPTPLLKTASYS